MRTIKLILILLVSSIANSQDGELDLSFANNGLYNPTNLNFTGSLLDLSVDSSNSIFISGNVVNSDNTKSIMVIKLLPDGEIDTSFGNNGYSYIHFSPTALVSKNIVLENGKIILVGRISSNTNDILIVKLNSNGSLDASFGTNGRVIIDSGFGDDRAFTVTEYNNSLIFGGYLWNQEGKSDFAILKLDMSGNLDTSFGDNGISRLTVPTKKGEIRDLVITNTGDIVACGKIRDESMPYYSMDRFAIIKMDQNGELDTSFGNNGLVIIPGSDNETAHSIKSFGNSFFITGHKYDPDNAVNSVQITKINNSGLIDTSFGINGKLIFTPGVPNSFYYGGFSSILQNNNKLVIGGYRPSSTIYTRINSDGTLDGNFGIDGSISFDFGFSPEGSRRALSKQFENKFLSLGLVYQAPDGVHHLFLTRHNIDQSLFINEDEINNFEYSIYPNPSSREFFIKSPTSESANGILYDITGKLISQFILNESENKIDVSSIASGIYFLKISNNANSFVKRIVIE